ncbi:MAG: CARDB domain-containing protein [Parcubacteria group bacterium]|jgi:hypothetical protein
MQTIKATKTRTVVSVALTVFAAGSILAAVVIIGNRGSSDPTSQADSSCSVDYDKIRQIFKEETAKINGVSVVPAQGGNVDLQITSFKAPSAGDSGCGTAIAVVKNAGNDFSGSFVVRLYIKNKAMVSQTVSGLEKGASTSVSIKYCDARSAGLVHEYVKIYTIVDPDNAVKETNEENNMSTKRDFEIF